MGPNINFAIAYAIGCLIVEVIVILRYEKKIDKLRESNRRLILDNISYRAVLSVTPNTTYNSEETRSDVKDAVKYAMKKSHPDNGGSADDFRKFRELYEEMEGKGVR